MVCVTFGPFAAGSNCTPSSSIAIDTKTISSSVMNNIQKDIASATSVASGSQLQNVAINGCGAVPIDIKQKMVFKVVNTSKLGSNFETNLANSMKNAITNDVDQKSKQINDLFGGVTGPEVSMAIKTAAQSITESNSFKESIKSSMNKAFGAQGQNISITCSQLPSDSADKFKSGSINISQDFLMEQTVNNILETVFKDMQKNESILTAVNKTAQSSETENKGLVAFFSSPGVIVVLIVACIVAGFIAWKKFGPKSK